MKCRRSQPTATDAPTGFTLVEMIIVMLIIGIIAAVSAPRMIDALSFHRVESAATRVRADLRLARKCARANSQTQAVQFTVATNSYVLPGISGLDHPGQDYQVDLHQAPLQANLTFANFGGNQVIVFDGYGLPDNPGTVVLQVGPHQRTVRVASDGFISVESN